MRVSTLITETQFKLFLVFINTVHEVQKLPEFWLASPNSVTSLVASVTIPTSKGAVQSLAKFM